MIQVSLYPDKMENAREARLLAQFDRSGEGYRAQMSEGQFEEFCKVNNLILYRDRLKNYQDGMVWGEISEV